MDPVGRVRTVLKLTRQRTRWWNWAGSLLGLGLLGIIIARSDPASVWAAWEGADPAWLGGAAVLYFAAPWLRAWRWHLLLGSVLRSDRSELFGLTLTCYALTNVLPGRAGELVRVTLLSLRHGVAWPTIGATAAAERVLDGLSLVGLLFLGIGLTGFPDWGLFAALFGAGVFSGALAAAWAVLKFGPAGPTGFGQLVRQVRRGLGGLARPEILAAAGGLTLASWVVEAGVFLAVGRALGLGLGLPAYLVVASVGNLAWAVPLAPGGLGSFDLAVREAAAVLGAGSGATAFGLLVHLVLWLPVTVVGIIWLGWYAAVVLAQGRPDRKGAS